MALIRATDELQVNHRHRATAAPEVLGRGFAASSGKATTPASRYRRTNFDKFRQRNFFDEAVLRDPVFVLEVGELDES